MTKKTSIVVNNVTMTYSKIYTKDELIAMFEGDRNLCDMSRRSYAKKLNISYDRVLSWFRPEREKNKISYEDAMHIIQAHQKIKDEEQESPTLESMSQEINDLRNAVLQLTTEIRNDRLKSMSGITKNHS